MEQKFTEPKKPELVVFAGPNGSGKSTFTAEAKIAGKYINADNIAKVLNCSVVDAALKAEQMRHDTLDAGEDFAFETVLSTDRNLLFMQEAKDKGYFLRGYFIMTDNPFVNLDRINGRVSNGGHDVPKDKVISRYYRSLQNLRNFVELCDICHVYDNSVSPNLLFRKYKLSETFYPSGVWTSELLYQLIGNPEEL